MTVVLIGIVTMVALVSSLTASLSGECNAEKRRDALASETNVGGERTDSQGAPRQVA
jgi:hypothetical protein